MAPYTQANRPIRVDTVLEKDLLLLNSFNGIEGMSQPFAAQVDLLSTSPDLDPAKLLRTPMLVTIHMKSGEKRLLHGICRRFSQGQRHDDLTVYRAEIVPWLWFLRLSRESRIYQENTVPEILELVFDRLGYADYELRLTRSYLPRTYCVQYRETHFDFVSRLMEEEGIFYFFDHTAEKHMLVLSDDSSLSKAAPGAETARFTEDDRHADDVIRELEREHAVHTGKVTLTDYDFEQPSLDLLRGQGDDEFEELYDYPGRYTQPDEGERLALLWLEVEEMQRQTVRGGGNVRGFIPGFHFTLQEHYRRDANGKYLITQVQHTASAGEYRAWDSNTEIAYSNTFTCIPDGTPYRPPRRTQRPLMYGSQSALVVGPSGEEIHTDKYGRVKVQFYWDRDGQRNEKSSCWIRVTTPWGGKGYGAVSIPRIGNEVVVAFEEGDPDRPIIIGSVYNADQTPPFDLPGDGITMGMNSRTSPGGGGNNQIAMKDTAGKEMITIHAQHDMETTVEHDQTVTVNDGNRTMSIRSGTLTDTSKGDAKLTIEAGSRTVSVTGGDYVAGASDAVKLHGKGKGVSILGDAKGVGITGNGTGVSIEGNGKGVTLKGDPSFLAEGTSKADITSPVVNIGNKTINIEGTTVTIAAGSNKIVLDSGGITINGSKVDIKGSSVKIN